MVEEVPTEDRSSSKCFAEPKGLRARVLQLEGEEWLLLRFDSLGLELPSALTAAEQEVVRLVVSGMSNAQIAARRGTHARTVANQLASCFAKLRVGSRAELTYCVLTREASCPRQ